jgi:hypothetical protein
MAYGSLAAIGRCAAALFEERPRAKMQPVRDEILALAETCEPALVECRTAATARAGGNGWAGLEVAMLSSLVAAATPGSPLLSTRARCDFFELCRLRAFRLPKPGGGAA